MIGTLGRRTERMIGCFTSRKGFSLRNIKEYGQTYFFSQKQGTKEEVVHRNQYNAGDTRETAQGTYRASHICIP